MRYKLKYKPLQLALFAALTCATFASCSNSEADTPSADDAKIPLTISAAINSGTQARKAGYDASAFATGDEIGLYILSTSDKESVYSSNYTCYNLRATCNGSSWTLDNDVYLYEDNAYIIAYYPYSESYGNSFPSSSSPITLGITPSSNEQTDVLTSAGVTVSRQSPTANLTFDHALTRVILSVGLSGDIETASLTSAAISASKLYSTATLSLSDGAFTAGSSSATASSFEQTLDATLDTTTRQTIDFLITSQSSTTLTATLAIDGKSYSVALTTDSWEAGYQYTYAINVIRTEQIYLEVESSSYIDGWTDQGTVDEIDINYQKTSSDSSGSLNGYEAVDLGLSVRWAACNVGASTQEEYGSFYAWGEIQEMNSSTDSSYTTYNQEIDDFSGNAEYDVATALWGGSWRIPTETEMQELVDNCTWEFTSVNDISGYEVTGTNGNSIFLPIGGYYSGTSHMSEGSHGAYWTSTPYETTTKYAWNLAFNSSSYTTESANRAHGHLVRPVTE